MKKTLRSSLWIALGLLCLGQNNAVAQSGCYAMKVASSNLYLTNTGQTLKVQAANNQANQIWLLKETGPYYVITPTTSNPNGNLDLAPSGSHVAVGGPFVGISPQFFTRTFIENDPSNVNIKRYGFFKDGQVMGAGNWGFGSTDPNVNDINLVPSSEAYTFGANKWILESKSCPSWVSSCDYALSVSSSNLTPAVNQDFTLTTTCTGPGCFGVGYEWLPNGQETSIGGMVQTVNMQYAMTVDYIIRGEKNGCQNKYANVVVTIGGSQLSSGRIGVDETFSQNEGKHELQVFPNPSKGEFEVDFYLEKGEPADISVTSIAGQTLQKRSLIGKGIHREKFEFGNIVPGMYLFNVIKRDNIEVKKVFISR